MRVANRRAALRLLVTITLAAACDRDPATPPGSPPGPSLADGLWTSSTYAPALLRLEPVQLDTSALLTAATTITTSSATLSALNSVAFAADGTMWVASEDDSRLLGFAASSLASSGERAATVVISSAGGSIALPTGLAFDRGHGLWVANYGNGTLARFSAAQLAAGGTPAPEVVLSGLMNPTALAFDADGALWVSDIQAGTISRFAPSQLAASGSPAPSRVLRGSPGTLDRPSGLAFDASGRLWVGTAEQRTIVAFGPARLSAGGTAEPDIVLSSGEGSLMWPVGLAFDASGALWVANVSSLEKLDPPALAQSGAPRPAARLQLRDNVLFWGAAFWPRPAGLPLN
jgi:sugar lactone lactonase YvrE